MPVSRLNSRNGSVLSIDNLPFHFFPRHTANGPNAFSFPSANAPLSENDCSSDNTHVPANRSCCTLRPAFSKRVPGHLHPEKQVPAGRRDSSRGKSPLHTAL